MYDGARFLKAQPKLKFFHTFKTSLHDWYSGHISEDLVTAFNGGT